jgi:hypothetical protein
VEHHHLKKSTMNTKTNPYAPAPRHPLALSLGLSERLQAAFPQVRQSATLLVQWLRAAVGLQAGALAAALAVDAELLAERDLIRECLRNDPPAHRRRIMATLNRVHAHHATLAAALATSEKLPPAR